MAIKRNKRFHAEVHASSMSDIMFFLLLFFLIISTLANPNVIKMTLPKSKTNEKTNKQLVSISVTEEKLYYIDKQQVPFEQLEKEFGFDGIYATKNNGGEFYIKELGYWVDY